MKKRDKRIHDLDASIKWTRAVKNDLQHGIEYKFDRGHIMDRDVRFRRDYHRPDPRQLRAYFRQHRNGNDLGRRGALAMIASAKYLVSGSIEALIDGAKVFIPDEAGNRHRRIVADWVAAGNTIAAYVAPSPPTDDEVRQGKVDGMGDVLLRVVLNHENRITMAQLKAALKALLDGS